MKRNSLLILFLFTCVNLYSQSVGYSYRILAAEGCSMKYSVSKQDTSYYIVASVHSDRMLYLNEPTMKIRTFQGDVFEVKGAVIGNTSESAGLMTGNIMIPVTEISSTAQFKVTPEQFELLKDGVAKIRLTMTPMNHERTFKKDKIGKKLYKLYLKARQQDEDF